MTKENEIPSSFRLLLGLLVGVLISVTMGQGVDFVAKETSIVASLLSVVIGLLSTYLLRLVCLAAKSPQPWVQLLYFWF